MGAGARGRTALGDPLLPQDMAWGRGWDTERGLGFSRRHGK